MFSGQPKELVRSFVIEVVVEEGSDPVVIEGRNIWGDGRLLGTSGSRRVMQAVWKSHDYRCPSYRLNDFRECRGEEVDPWSVPSDMADAWSAAVAEQLELDQPPFSLTLVRLETPLDDAQQLLVDAQERFPVFTWQPAGGTYEVESHSAL